MGCIERNGCAALYAACGEAKVLRQGVAIFLAPGPVPVYFDRDSVVQIIDTPAHSSP